LMPPYFPAHVFVERGAGRVRVCDEDYLFCAKARKAGWSVLLHPAAKCGHFDRARETIAPAEWEAPEVTRVTRMAVIQDGRYALVPARDGTAGTPEAHVAADVHYIVVP
jgi:hypothetical protein